MKKQLGDGSPGVDCDVERRCALGWIGGAVALGTLASVSSPTVAQSSGAPAAAVRRRGVWACAIQMRVDAVNGDETREAARRRMRASIERTARQIRGAKSWIGSDLGLVVLPEYFLTGFPTTESIPQWIDKAVLDMDGEEYAALGRVAQDNAVYLAGNAYERDPKFPGIFFQCSFLIAPDGDVVLRYRRLVSNLVPTPYDVWDRYLDVYGLDGVFPVARTPFGRLAAIASEEILYPEIARCHAMRGAEIFLHSSSEAYTTTLAPKRVARMARALENLAWVVSCNSAGVDNIDIALGSADGGSEIVDHMGSVVVTAGQGETMTAHARIDLEELREYRRRIGIANLYVRQPFELYAGSYAAADFRRPNGLLDGGRIVVPERRWFRERQQETLQRLERRGLVPQEDGP
jgi:predicted amidohydrolase